MKPHLHQVWTDDIVGAYFEALDLELDALTNEMALELLANDCIFLWSRGRQAFLDALSKLFISVGAADRVKQPDGPLGPRVVSATLGHFALVVTKVRNALEIAAGTRSSARGGAIGDGHFPCGWRKSAAWSRPRRRMQRRTTAWCLWTVPTRRAACRSSSSRPYPGCPPYRGRDRFFLCG